MQGALGGGFGPKFGAESGLRPAETADGKSADPGAAAPTDPQCLFGAIRYSAPGSGEFRPR